jgi:hypothetical protein
MPAGYSYVLSEAASDFAFRLPPAEQRRLAVTLRLLASQPNREGHYTANDDTGRLLQNLLLDDWVITYWPDHAVKELRIADIVQV